MRRQHSLVEISGFQSVHTCPNEGCGAGRDHLHQNVIYFGLGVGAKGQGKEKRCSAHQKVLLWNRQIPAPRTTIPNSAVLQTGIQLSTGWLRMRCRMITLMSEVFGRT